MTKVQKIEAATCGVSPVIGRTPIRNRRTKPRPGRLEGEALKALRQECFERDDWHCRECFRSVYDDLHHMAKESAHMAHIQAKRRGGDVLSNVRTLCGGCHRDSHQFGPSMTKPCPKKPEVTQ